MHVSLPYTDNPQIRSNSTQFHPDPGYPVSRSFPYRVANIRRVTDRFPGRPVQGGRMRINRGQIHFLPEPRTAAPFLNGLTPAPVNRCLVTSFDPNTTRNPADAPTPTTDATPNRVTVPRSNATPILSVASRNCIFSVAETARICEDSKNRIGDEFGLLAERDTKFDEYRVI